MELKNPENLKTHKIKCFKEILQIVSESRDIILACVIFIISFSILIWLNMFLMRSGDKFNNEAITLTSNYSKNNTIVNTTTNLKYILLWHPTDYFPFYHFGIGQQAFSRHSCRYQNCYVTDNRTFLPNITQFNAIAFNGIKFLKRDTKNDLPQLRSYNQKYVYINAESATNEPLCQPYYDNYFNWTATFKLKSDLVMPYIQALDRRHNVVAPKLKPNWIKFENMTPVDPSVIDIIRPKHRAAAWIASNCLTNSHRENYVKALQRELSHYGFTVDVYGVCGLSMSRCKNKSMMEKIKNEYYFYLAFENDFDEDYVTEKVLKGLEHYTIPIVLGGASYERFLPPHSYIKANDVEVKNLTRLMVELIQSPDLYIEYFRWRNHYSYRTMVEENCICSLCEALNDVKKMEYSNYPNLRQWWNGNYMRDCNGKIPKKRGRKQKSKS